MFSPLIKNFIPLDNPTPPFAPLSPVLVCPFHHSLRSFSFLVRFGSLASLHSLTFIPYRDHSAHPHSSQNSSYQVLHSRQLRYRLAFAHYFSTCLTPLRDIRSSASAPSTHITPFSTASIQIRIRSLFLILSHTFNHPHTLLLFTFYHPRDIRSSAYAPSAHTTPHILIPRKTRHIRCSILGSFHTDSHPLTMLHPSHTLILLHTPSKAPLLPISPLFFNYSYKIEHTFHHINRLSHI